MRNKAQKGGHGCVKGLQAVLLLDRPCAIITYPMVRLALQNASVAKILQGTRFGVQGGGSLPGHER
jgi:hypothetical protein